MICVDSYNYIRNHIKYKVIIYVTIMGIPAYFSYIIKNYPKYIKKI